MLKILPGFWCALVTHGHDFVAQARSSSVCECLAKRQGGHEKPEEEEEVVVVAQQRQQQQSARREVRRRVREEHASGATVGRPEPGTCTTPACERSCGLRSERPALVVC